MPPESSSLSDPPDADRAEDGVDDPVPPTVAPSSVEELLVDLSRRMDPDEPPDRRRRWARRQATKLDRIREESTVIDLTARIQERLMQSLRDGGRQARSGQS